MKRGKSTIYYEFSTPADFLIHVINRSEWRKHHRYECMAIQSIIDENRLLKTELANIHKKNSL